MRIVSDAFAVGLRIHAVSGPGLRDGLLVVFAVTGRRHLGGSGASVGES